MPPNKLITPPYQWTSIETERHDKDIGEEAIKPTKDIKDVSPHSEKEEDHKPTNPPTEIPHQEEHASSADKWDTLPEIAQGGRRRKASISSTTMITTSRSIFHQPPYRETT